MVIAWSAAQHYFNGAEQPYLRVQSSFYPPAENISSWRPIGLGELAPVVSNISFALELLLKVHSWQEHPRPPRGHDLRELWSKLSPPQRAGVEAHYVDRLKRGVAGHLKLKRISISQTQSLDQSLEEPAPTCLLAIADLNKSFEQWRYMHEALDRFPQALSFHFMTAFALVHALNESIKQFRGNRQAEYAITLRSEA